MSGHPFVYSHVGYSGPPKPFYCLSFSVSSTQNLKLVLKSPFSSPLLNHFLYLYFRLLIQVSYCKNLCSLPPFTTSHRDLCIKSLSDVFSLRSLKPISQSFVPRWFFLTFTSFSYTSLNIKIFVIETVTTLSTQSVSVLIRLTLYKSRYDRVTFTVTCLRA